MLSLNIIAVEGKSLGSKGSLLTQIHCNTNADCKDPHCICADFNLCFCGELPTKQSSFNDMKFEEIKEEDFKN